MPTISITDNQNIIKELNSSDLDEKIDISSQTKFNYFVYAKNSQINVTLQTLWDFVSWNVFVVCYWQWECTWNIITKINHSHSNINVLILSILQDDNSVSLNWDIVVAKWISQSQWHLLEKNLIVWKKIKVKVIPRLDVYSCDVQSTHWVSIDKMDTQNLYYMMSRGLSQKESQNLLISWHIQNILQNFDEISDMEKQDIQSTILSSIAMTND